jgi:hypothetical protein
MNTVLDMTPGVEDCPACGLSERGGVRVRNKVVREFTGFDPALELRGIGHGTRGDRLGESINGAEERELAIHQVDLSIAIQGIDWTRRLGPRRIPKPQKLPFLQSPRPQRRVVVQGSWPFAWNFHDRGRGRDDES